MTRRVTTVGLAVVAAVLVGTGVACSSDDQGARSSDARSSDTRSSDTRSSDTRSSGPLAGVDVRLVDLDLDVNNPVDMTYRPDSTSLLIAERDGRVREAVPDAEGFALVDEPVLDITARVGNTDSEKGLLGLAVSPDGSTLYVSYTEAGRGDSRIDAYPLSGSDGSLRADPLGRRQLVAIAQPFANHNGGSLEFGPDGMLYAGFGDGGGADDPTGNGQNRDTLLGKVLRIDPKAPDGVPADNPFAGGGGQPLIWATGLRNPWRMDFDPATGDLWIADVGQVRYEEIDVLRAAEGTGRGANLGWDLFEGTSRFDKPDPAAGAASAGPFVVPVYVYGREGGCAVAGGVVYRGRALPGLDGAYLFGDFCRAGVRAIRVDGRRTVERADLGLDVASVVSFGRGPDGEVYVISLDDGIKRLAPA